LVRPLPAGLKVGHYEDEGLRYDEVDRHGHPLTYTTPADLERLHLPEDLSPWNRAALSFLTALPRDTRVILYWCYRAAAVRASISAWSVSRALHMRPVHGRTPRRYRPFQGGGRSPPGLPGCGLPHRPGCRCRSDRGGNLRAQLPPPPPGQPATGARRYRP